MFRAVGRNDYKVYLDSAMETKITQMSLAASTHLQHDLFKYLKLFKSWLFKAVSCAQSKFSCLSLRSYSYRYDSILNSIFRLILALSDACLLQAWSRLVAGLTYGCLWLLPAYVKAWLGTGGSTSLPKALA